jgi:TonB family protein
MKHWITVALLACCLAGCQSTEGLYAEGPVKNQVQFSGTYLTSDQVDQPPVPTRQVPPEYPSVMLKARLDGTAFITMIVSPTGQPEQVQVSEATHPRFAEAAVAAVKKWQFKPATKDGQPVAVQWTVPIQFSPQMPTSL